MEEKNGECRCPHTSEIKRNSWKGEEQKKKGVIKHGGKKPQMIIHRKDTGSNATGSEILPVGINSKDE